MTTSSEKPLGSQNSYVYESPDGGRTVYQRAVGSTSRILTEESKLTMQRMVEERLEDSLWANIREAAKTDPALKELLEQAKVLYLLSKEKTSETDV